MSGCLPDNHDAMIAAGFRGIQLKRMDGGQKIGGGTGGCVWTFELPEGLYEIYASASLWDVQETSTLEWFGLFRTMDTPMATGSLSAWCEIAWDWNRSDPYFSGVGPAGIDVGAIAYIPENCQCWANIAATISASSAYALEGWVYYRRLGGKDDGTVTVTEPGTVT